MAFGVPVWLAVQEELLQLDEGDGDAPSCFDELDDVALFDLFHLSRDCIAFVVDAVRVRMKKYTLKTPLYDVDSMVMVALNYYAHGVCSTAVLQRLRPTPPSCPMNTVGVVGVVSGVIAGMSDQFVSFPLSMEARRRVAAQIKLACGIPHALGVLAPAHFKIMASPYEGNFKGFLNTQGYTSVVSQLICDSTGNILSVEKCCVGGTCEQELWETSFKGKEMEEELHGPFWVIGGKGYRQSKHVLVPVPEPADDADARFNEAHAKMYEVMRATLGSMKARFRCLRQLGFAQEGSLNKKSNIIKSCSVLHNIALKFSVPPPPQSPGTLEPFLPSKKPPMAPLTNAEGLKLRQELIDANFSVASSGAERESSSKTEEDVGAAISGANC